MNDLRATVTIKGHPLHPLLVTIPVGLFVAALVSDIAFVTDGSPRAGCSAAGWRERCSRRSPVSPTSRATRAFASFATPGYTCSPI